MVEQDTQALLALASKAARAAADVLRGAQASQIKGKSNPRDLVTEWDPRSEQTIREVLSDSGYPVLGEEGGTGGGPVDPNPSHRWLVDPIDGTVNFAHGMPIWSISIALEEVGRGTLVGVVYAPVLGWWFEASLGGGARDGTGRVLRVSTCEQLDQSMLTTGFPYDLATHPVNNLAEWSHFQRAAGTCRRFGAASLDMCFVATGWCDGYWERKLAVGHRRGSTDRDRGGWQSDEYDGRSVRPALREAVASNGAIHDELVTELARVRP